MKDSFDGIISDFKETKIDIQKDWKAIKKDLAPIGKWIRKWFE